MLTIKLTNKNDRSHILSKTLFFSIKGIHLTVFTCRSKNDDCIFSSLHCAQYSSVSKFLFLHFARTLSLHYFFYYRVCHRFRLTQQDDYFWVNFGPFLKRVSFFEAAGAVLKIDLSLKPNHHVQFQLAQISETICTRPGMSYLNFLIFFKFRQTICFPNYTECVTDLDNWSKMIIF